MRDNPETEMLRQRIKQSIARRIGPLSIPLRPSFRRACQLRFELLHETPTVEQIEVLFRHPILANRITAYNAIRTHRMTVFTPQLMGALEHQRRFIERAHIYAALDTLGVASAIQSSPQASRNILTVDGPRDLEIACEEQNARLVRAVELLRHLPPAAQSHLDLRGLSRHERLRLIQSCGLQSQLSQLPNLIDWLFRVDVDPGHGFAFRSALAEAIGRMGLPVGGILIRALEQEALEYEGRPGAGLGIQRSVRRKILSALGECETDGSPNLGLILEYLSNVTGSASAGFYIEGLNVLWKWQHPKLLQIAMKYPRAVRQNALGVYASFQQDHKCALDEFDMEFWTKAQRHYISENSV